MVDAARNTGSCIFLGKNDLLGKGRRPATPFDRPADAAPFVRSELLFPLLAPVSTGGQRCDPLYVGKFAGHLLIEPVSTFAPETLVGM